MPELNAQIRQIIVQRRQRGEGVRAIARALQISPSTVTKTMQRFNDTGSTLSRPRSGRPRATTAREDRLIHRSQLADRRRSSNEVRNLLPQLRVSSRTVRRRIREFGLLSCPATKKPLVSVRNRQVRRRWATLRQNVTVDQWSQVLFSDESKVNRLNCDGWQRLRRTRDEKLRPFALQPTATGGGGSIMVWGCMSAQGVAPLVRLHATMNAQRYHELLQQTALPYLRTEMPAASIFQQDNAPCHKA